MDDLSTQQVKDTFQRLLQIDPDDGKVINGTGSAYLIPTGSISNFASNVANVVNSYGYITSTGVVFTTQPNTGSINLSGSFKIDGNIQVGKNNSIKAEINEKGFIRLEQFTDDISTLTSGSLFYSGSDLYIIT